MLELIDFNPEAGYISLADRRIMLMRADTFRGQRAELLEELGSERIRSLYSRLGYADGTGDAAIAQLQKPEASFEEAFLVGPQLHALFGMASVETVAIEINEQQFYGEFLTRGSIEADAHVEVAGRSPEPVCWMQSGYASGFASAFMGMPILFREVECRAMGHEACRLIGRPLNRWRQLDPDAGYFHPQDFVNRFDLSEQQRSLQQYDGALNEGVVGISAGFSRAMSRLNKVASTLATVLLQGETGVGKEVFARSLHRVSPNAAGPFVAVNCAALPAELIEAELFGVERGGYTGAVTSRPGRFERAEGGTLFLDEISSLSVSSQGKLLRALQQREVERVGGTETRPVNTRVVAATNLDLLEAVEAGHFRRDLYYRLSVFPLRIPPLRERKEDIPLLIEYFRQKYTQLHQLEVDGFTRQAVTGLINYSFPGNIRELENMVERGVIMAAGRGVISLQDMAADVGWGGGASGELPLGDGRRHESLQQISRLLGENDSELPDLRAIEALLVDLALQRSGGNVAAAGRLLGLTRRQMAYRVEATEKR